VSSAVTEHDTQAHRGANQDPIRDEDLDLTPLEDAAARAGLPGLKARLVPPDRRRGAWFTRRGDVLQVNERVVERLTPPEGQALLVGTLLQWKHLARHRRRVVGLITAYAALLIATGRVAPDVLLATALVLCAPVIVLLFVGWSRAMFAADDESVELLGDPEVLVRAMNVVNQDRLDIGGKRVEARPDLHRRAERLVDKHQLRLPPERRTVPVMHGSTGCGAGWDATGTAVPGASGGGSSAGGGGVG
jgi:uncharacterized membrane protein YgcG